VKSLALRKLRNRSGALIPGTDKLEGFEVRANHVRLCLRPKRMQALLVEMDARSQLTFFRAKHHDSSVDKFLPLHARNNANYRVIK